MGGGDRGDSQGCNGKKRLSLSCLPHDRHPECSEGSISSSGIYAKLIRKENASRLPTTDHRLLSCIIRPTATFFREEGKSRKQLNAPRLPTTDYRPLKPIALKKYNSPKPCKSVPSSDSISWKEEMIPPGSQGSLIHRFPSAQTLRERKSVGKRAAADLESPLPSPRRASRQREFARPAQKAQESHALCRSLLDDSRSTKFKCHKHYEPRNVLAPISILPHSPSGPSGPFWRGRK